MIEIRQLRHFLAVVEAGGFRSASREVHLSPPALTRSIQMLEGHYGVPLLDRSGARVTPTAIGRQLVLLARRVVNGFDDIPNHIDQLAGLRTGRLRVGVSPLVADLWMKPVTARMVREHEGIEMHVTIGMADALLDRLSHHGLDIVIGHERALELHGGLNITRLYADRVAWWSRKGHPLAGNGGGTLTGLAAYPLLFQPLPLTYHEWLDDLAIAVHRDTGASLNVEGTLQCTDYAMLIDTARQTDGLALLPVRNVALDDRHQDLHRLDFPVPPPVLHMSMASPKLTPPPPIAEKFLDVVKEQIALIDRQVEACGFSDLLP